MEKALEGAEAYEVILVFMRFDLEQAEGRRISEEEDARAPEPHQRVHAEEEKGADDESGHGHEDDEEHRIVLEIEMVGMRHVGREVGARVRMALLARR